VSCGTATVWVVLISPLQILSFSLDSNLPQSATNRCLKPSPVVIHFASAMLAALSGRWCPLGPLLSRWLGAVVLDGVQSPPCVCSDDQVPVPVRCCVEGQTTNSRPLG